MNYFLIAYDRRAGRVLCLKEFEEARRSDALAERFSLELQYRASGNVEVVVLGAASLDDLRRTHSRYFMSRAAPAEQAG